MQGEKSGCFVLLGSSAGCSQLHICIATRCWGGRHSARTHPVESRSLPPQACTHSSLVLLTEPANLTHPRALLCLSVSFFCEARGSTCILPVARIHRHTPCCMHARASAQVWCAGAVWDTRRPCELALERAAAVCVCPFFACHKSSTKTWRLGPCVIFLLYPLEPSLLPRRARKPACVQVRWCWCCVGHWAPQ